jgi:hypothetical protein
MPMQAPELPRKRIIAACYAANQPDESLWQRYLAEVHRLRKEETVSSDDYFLLRHSLQARAALMDLTLGEEAAFAIGTVQEILDIVKGNIQRDLQSKLEEEQRLRQQTELDAAATIEDVGRTARETIKQRESALAVERLERQSLLNKMAEQEQARHLRIRARAVRWAHTVSRIVGFGAFLLLAIGSAAAFPWWGPTDPKSRVRFVIAGLQGLLLVWGLINWSIGTSVKTLIRQLETTLAAFFERKLTTLALDEPDQLVEGGPYEI